MELDPDDGDVDGDDNGLQPGGLATRVTSAPATIGIGEEPTAATTETAPGADQDDGASPTDDANGNMTIDFGFFAPVVEVGDLVFVDLNENGIQDTGESGLPGVTVRIFNADGSPVTNQSDGTTPYPNETTTDEDGGYSFESLPPGDYFVTFDLGTAENADLYVYTLPNAGGDDATDSDAISTDGVAGQSGTTGFLFSGESDATLDAGVICNLAVTVADPFTICSTQPIDLTLDATVTPASLGGRWASDGDGVFQNAAGEALSAPFPFMEAVLYLPGRGDTRRGNVTLTLTTSDPGSLVPPSFCPPVSASVTVEVLRVDCGSFFWDGE